MNIIICNSELATLKDHVTSICLPRNVLSKHGITIFDLSTKNQKNTLTHIGLKVELSAGFNPFEKYARQIGSSPQV